MHAIEHFVVRVQEINSDGVWGHHPHSGMLSFFAMPHIILIAQEIELNPENPEHAQILQEYEQRTGKKVESDLGTVQEQTAPPKEEVPFVDIDYLESLAAQTKMQDQNMEDYKKRRAMMFKKA